MVDRAEKIAGSHGLMRHGPWLSSSKREPRMFVVLAHKRLRVAI